MAIQERYNSLVIAANSTNNIPGGTLGGFLCTVAGTITIVDGAGLTILNAFPVTAGLYYPLPMITRGGLYEGGGTFTTAGGAAGTLLI